MVDDDYRADIVELHVLFPAHFHAEPCSALGDAINGPDPPNNTQLPPPIQKGAIAPARLLLLLHTVTTDCLFEAIQGQFPGSGGTPVHNGGLGGWQLGAVSAHALCVVEEGWSVVHP